MKVGFSILHYMTHKDTIECVDSIFENMDCKNYVVVIVDNHSNNGSIEIIEDKYKDNNRVTIIKNDSNLGFAAGNNIGYRYCRENLGCDTIIVCNNDTKLLEKNICKKISDDMQKESPAIIGPDIISEVDGKHQNPMAPQDFNLKELKKELNRYRLLRILNILGLYDILKRAKDKNKKAKVEDNKELNIKQADVQLHGSWLIFTPIFTTGNKDCFNEKTFLYMEEALLKQFCSKNGLVQLYDPRIKVSHKEDSATNKIRNTDRKKREFVFKNMIRSLVVLIREVKSTDQRSYK